MTTARTQVAFTLAEWFGCGRAPRAPGTVGTLGAFPIYLLLRAQGPLALLGAALVVSVVGVWAATIVEEASGKPDPQNVVIDEVAGMLVALSATPPTWPAVIVAFLAFRLFDWAKPWPARAAERLPGGFGIVVDDLVAGAWVAVLVLGLRVGGLL